MKTYIAIDLGAGSGRVILGTLKPDGIDLLVVHRFPNGFSKEDGHDRWDFGLLWTEIKKGLTLAAQTAKARGLELRSVGADTWGVDYGLLDNSGKLLDNPIAYRDARTEGVMDKVFSIIPKNALYRTTGIQFMSFNTIFQLFVHIQGRQWPPEARRLLMMPDLIHHKLCGIECGEYTIASTGQLVNVKSRKWDDDLFDALELFRDVMPDLRMPGTKLAHVLHDLCSETGLPEIPVVLPGSHDTASAVAGTPLNPGWAYISSGTWSLVGIESKVPFVDDRAYNLNYTNEGGVYGTYRFLKNVMGLWILESCRKEWQVKGGALGYDALIPKLESLPFIDAYINPDDTTFLNPDSMLGALTAFFKRTGQPSEWSELELSAIILQSLAVKYAMVILEIEEITGKKIQGLHIVGGGSQNRYLNRLTAGATGLPVSAGPVEATALGNILVQAITDNVFKDLAGARDFIRKHMAFESFEPGDTAIWMPRIKAFKLICGK